MTDVSLLSPAASMRVDHDHEQEEPHPPSAVLSQEEATAQVAQMQEWLKKTKMELEAQVEKLAHANPAELVEMMEARSGRPATASKSLVDLQAKQKSEYPWSEEALDAMFFDVGGMVPMSSEELKLMLSDIPRLPTGRQCMAAKWGDKSTLSKVPKEQQDLVCKVSIEVQHLMFRVLKPLCALMNEVDAACKHVTNLPVPEVNADSDDLLKSFAAELTQHKTGLLATQTLARKTVRIQQDCLVAAVEKWQKDVVFKHIAGTSASELRAQQLKYTDSYDPELQQIVHEAHKKRKWMSSMTFSAPNSQPFRKGGFGNSGGRGSYHGGRNNFKSSRRNRGRFGGGGTNFDVVKRWENGHSSSNYSRGGGAARGQFSFGGGKSAPQGNERGGRGRGGRR